MESKNIIIGGLALAVVGGGAYFFLKNKRLKDASKLAELEKLGQGVNIGVATVGSTTASTPDKVLDSAPVTNAQLQANQQELTRLTQANSISNQIQILRQTKKTIPPINYNTFSTWASDSASISTFNQGVENQITNLKEQMKLLGYKEDNGLAVKI
jgi:hypothetical protein